MRSVSLFLQGISNRYVLTTHETRPYFGCIILQHITTMYHMSRCGLLCVVLPLKPAAITSYPRARGTQRYKWLR